MNNYGFDYFNYMNNIPANMNYPNLNQNIEYNTQYNKNNQDMMKDNNYYQNTNINQLYNPSSGFMKGNLFKNLYDPYKNYKVTDLNPKNEKEAMLYQLMQYKFVLTELNLYLDTHPKDIEMISLYRKYLEIEKQMTLEYEKMYGPITCDSLYIGNNSWTWNNSPWPWEVK